MIGRTNLPVVNEGDACFHIATPAKPVAPDAMSDHLELPALYDEDEII